jgi:hypothetical protein
MKKVYIAAPFSANEHHTQEENIARAVEIGRKVKRRVFPIIPHIALAFIDEATERDMAMDRCKELINICDEVWMCTNNITPGMKEEEEYAKSIGKDILYQGGMF